MPNGHAPLKPELINSALKKNRGKPVQAEKIKRYRESFVDPKVFDSLTNNNTHVIYGRRGTGKTHLLGTLHEAASAGQLEGKVISFFFSAHDFLVSPEAVPGKHSDKVMAYIYFDNFLHQLVDQLFASVSGILDSKSRWDLFGLRTQRDRNRVEVLILELLDLAERGEMCRYPVGRWVEEEKTEDISETTGQVGAEGSIRVDALGPGASVRAQAGSAWSGKHTSSTRRELETEGPLVMRTYSVRKKLERIVEALGLDLLLILIDEWMTLDYSAMTEVQPEFAELLKRTLLGTQKIGLKIASNPFQTRLNNRGSSGKYKGMEINADIYECVNLDYALLPDEELLYFYRVLLFRRLRLFEPDIAYFEDVNNPDTPVEAFVYCIFENAAAFREMVRGAQGNPRQFLVLVNSCCSSIDFDVRKSRIDFDLVQERIRRTSVGATQSEMRVASDGELLLFRCIKPVVERSGSHLFLVRRTSIGRSQRLRRAEDELSLKKLITEYPEVNLPSHVRDDFKGYLIDYGTYLDWQRSIEFVSGRKLPQRPDTIVPHIGQNEDPNTFVVDDRTLSTIFPAD